MDKKEIVIVPYHYAPNGDGNKDLYFWETCLCAFGILLLFRSYSMFYEKVMKSSVNSRCAL